jgi:periplasmic protein TonB
MGHASCLALAFFLLSDHRPPVPEPIAKGGIQVVFERAPPKFEAAPQAEPLPQPETPLAPVEAPPPPEPQAEAVPPPPEPPIAATESAPEAPVAASEPAPPVPEAPVAATEPPTPPPPPLKPTAKKAPKPVQRYQEPPQPSQAALPAAPAPPVSAAPPQTASAATPVPAPAPSPEVTAGYRALLSSWLDGHKRYPDGARQRGEEGRAVLRFAVDRSGRVLDYAVITSSGYPDLDQSIEEMMRGATLPPFPQGMPQPRMEVSVTIRFSLRR